MCQKCLAEFAARRRQRNKIIFSRDMCVRENTSRAASVEFVRHRRTNYARSRPQAFCRKNPEGFSTVSSRPPGLLFVYTHYIIMYYSKLFKNAAAAAWPTRRCEASGSRISSAAPVLSSAARHESTRHSPPTPSTTRPNNSTLSQPVSR